MKSSDSRSAAAGGRRRQPAARSRLRASLPFVLVNMSMTADGKIASSNRAVSSFGSRRDHTHLLELRATADAVMCGARTVDLNQVNLGSGGARFRTQRLKRGLAEAHLRIIVSGSGTLSPDAHLFSRDPSQGHQAGVRNSRNAPRLKSPILILTTARAGRARLARLRSVADEVKVFGTTRLNLRAALAWLRKRWKVKRLVCEGGGELNDAMFRAGLVDELHLTWCPKILGGRQAPTLADGIGAGQLARARPLQLKSARRVGDELFLVYCSCTASR